VTTGTHQAAGLAEALAELGPTTLRLSELSRRWYQNPYTAVRWPRTVRPEADWFGAPEHSSLYGTPEWETLAPDARRRLAFLEAANFYSLNIHGEKHLMRGLAERLYRPDLLDVAVYLHHFLDEENKHSVWFGGFCTRYATVYRSRQVPHTPGDPAPRDVADLLFFARTLVFEEIVDRLNRIQARDRRLHPLARFINGSHHADEARHLAFGRRLVRVLWQTCSPHWTPETVADIRQDLGQYLTTAWREYYNPEVYADAGLPDPWELAERAWRAPAQRQRRREVSARALRFLLGSGILTEEPADAF
jgi:hypothetical protein